MSMGRSIAAWVVLSTMAGLLEGCLSTGSACRIVVSNAGDAAIRDVRVVAGGAALYTATEIRAHAEGDYGALDGPMPPVTVVRWKNPDGQEIEREVKSDKPAPSGFRGRVLYQVDGRGGVRRFLTPESKDGGGVIPWDSQGNWDGTLLIPGMSQP